MYKGITFTLFCLLCQVAVPVFAVVPCDQPIVRILNDKSRNITAATSSCGKTDYGAHDDVFLVGQQGRLWIAAFEGQDKPVGYQVVCQNRTAVTVTLRLQNRERPWIEVIDQAECSEWSGKTLRCIVDGQKNGFFCSATDIRSASLRTERGRKTGGVQKTTSFKLRGFKAKKRVQTPLLVQWITSKRLMGAPPQIVIDREINRNRAIIDLCARQHNAKQPFVINWKIDGGGRSFDIAVNQVSPEDHAAADCIVEEINGWTFPSTGEGLSVRYRFDI